MSDEKLPEHLNGLSGYVRQFSSDEDTVYLLSRIRYIRLCMGCVIEAEPDAEEQVANFLLEFAVNSRGLLFMHDTLYDCFDGPMAGPVLPDKNE